MTVQRPAQQTELEDLVATNYHGARLPLWVQGGGTALPVTALSAADNAPRQTLLDLRGIARVVDYPARDLTVTVEAGMTVAALQELLATEGQRLPIDVPAPDQTTIGAALACNLAGPQRYGHGTLRDYVIGITGVDAQGRRFHGGGRVVKNVAGYDLCKLLVGSRGTLAAITQVTFKLRPQAEQLTWLWTTWNQFAAIEPWLTSLLNSAARPVAVECVDTTRARQIAHRAGVALPVAGTDTQAHCAIAVEGTGREVQWQIEQLKREAGLAGPSEFTVISEADALALLAALVDNLGALPAGVHSTWKAAVRPSRAMAMASAWSALGLRVQVQCGSATVWGFVPVDGANPADTVVQLSNSAAQSGATAELWCDAAHPGGAPAATAQGTRRIMQQLKQSLDPHCLWAPGWLFGK